VHAESVFKNKKQLYSASVAEPFVDCRLGKSLLHITLRVFLSWVQDRHTDGRTDRRAKPIMQLIRTVA